MKAREMIEILSRNPDAEVAVERWDDRVLEFEPVSGVRTDGIGMSQVVVLKFNHNSVMFVEP